MSTLRTRTSPVKISLLMTANYSCKLNEYQLVNTEIGTMTGAELKPHIHKVDIVGQPEYKSLRLKST